MAIYNLEIKNINLQIEFFETEIDLKNIIENNLSPGRLFLGPVQTKHTKILNNYCNYNVIFFSFSSRSSLANDCVYLLNFFPKNELSQLLLYLKEDAKVALLYPENEYGYLINSYVDDVIFESLAILVNRSSYKDDLSNVRDSIKELGKYDLRKYELNRQKQILSSKKDEKSIQRLKKLERFKTTSDYDFTHILIADYGLNLLQVAPLLPFYDIDPNIVQFMGTGVIDDKTFFYEPSLQGAIFPGIAETRRINIINNPAVLSVGMVKAGTRNNIIPEESMIMGTIRTFDPVLRKEIYDEIEQIAEGVAKGTGTKVKVEFDVGGFYPVTVNNPELVEKMSDSLKAASPGRFYESNIPVTGAEDFSYFSQEIPGLYFWLGVNRPGEGESANFGERTDVPGNHSPYFIVDDSALDKGVKALTYLVLDYPEKY